MILSPKLQNALNDQINAEYYSSYLYLSMAAHFEVQNLPGFAHWMRLQAKEEAEHALKFYEYILERRGRVELRQIAAPPTSWDTPVAVFEQTMRHEEEVSERINRLVELAGAEKDNGTLAFLQWFVSEQVEEESRADAILQRVRLTAGSIGGLFVLDHHLGKRA